MIFLDVLDTARHVASFFARVECYGMMHDRQTASPVSGSASASTHKAL